MLTRRRRESRDHAAPRLPDTIARLVTFLVMTETRGGKRKATRIRVLTTLLDHEDYPALEIAVPAARCAASLPSSRGRKPGCAMRRIAV